MELMTYKCPNCDAAIVFDSKKQQFLCEFCSSVFTQEQLEEYMNKLNAATPENIPENSPEADADAKKQNKRFEWQETDNNEKLKNVSTYSCEFCGAQIITDLTTAATECPYCNNPIIIASKLSGGNQPDLIIPFKLQKEEAVKQLKKFYRNKIFLPSEFKSKNKVKSLTGIYVPFWLFDCEASADVHFSAIKNKNYSDSTYDYTETSHYDVFRSGTLAFDKVPVDGSSKMADNYMDAIEPFDYSGLVDFNAAYLSGFLADRYNLSAKRSMPRADKRISNSICNQFKNTVTGYDGVDVSTKSIDTSNGIVRYALFPVWILNTKYKDKTYTFAMNGQTGKLVGELPIDKKKYWGLFAAVVAVGMTIAQFIIF